MLITAMVATARPAPLHLMGAPTPGTGKSYLVDVAAVIATGRECPVSSAADKDDETEKRLVGCVLGGYPIISIDNISRELGGDFLCQATERTLVRVRPLGRSDNTNIEVKSFFVGTGNNARVKGDMVRRTLIASLDAQMERPELRSFDFDPVKRVLDDRGRYITAILTIVRAYIVASKPGRLTQIGSYRHWSDLVRSPLVWLGEADPVEVMERVRDNDPELESLREVVNAWREAFGVNAPMTAVQLATHATQDRPELRDALLKVAGNGNNIVPRTLGRFLASNAGRIVGEWQIAKGRTASGGAPRYMITAAPARRSHDGFGGFNGSNPNPSRGQETFSQTGDCNDDANEHTHEYAEQGNGRDSDLKHTNRNHQTHSGGPTAPPDGSEGRINL
jgi:putative DNA primase/helicase